MKLCPEEISIEKCTGCEYLKYKDDGFIRFAFPVDGMTEGCCRTFYCEKGQASSITFII